MPLIIYIILLAVAGILDLVTWPIQELLGLNIPKSHV